MMASVQKGRSAAGTEFWKATWREGAPGGARRQKAKSFATKAEAKRHAALMEATVESRGIGSPEQFTLRSYFDYWLGALERSAQKSPTTLIGYRRGADIVCRFLGSVPLTKLSVAMLEAAYGEMLVSGRRVKDRPSKRRGLAPVTIRNNVHKTLSAALSDAVRWKWLPSNVAMEARPPRVEAERIKLFTPDEVARMVQTAQADPELACIVALLLSSGCRRGELLGIGKDSLGADGALTIARNVVAGVGHQPIVRVPKTKAGVRTVRLPADVAALLASQLARVEARALRWGPGYRREPLLAFSNPDGSPMVPVMLSQRLRALKKRAGVTSDASPIHGWRHTSATAMLRSVPIAAVAKRLGHSSARTTLAIYAHSDDADDALAAEALGALLDRSMNVATALPHGRQKRRNPRVTSISRDGEK